MTDPIVTLLVNPVPNDSKLSLHQPTTIKTTIHNNRYHSFLYQFALSLPTSVYFFLYSIETTKFCVTLLVSSSLLQFL